MFDCVLVANRGEIARRVIRTCRRLGVRTVAVFTDLDAGALHVRDADHAVRVPSYLDVDAVVRAALASGAQAVHPGYGFLSENAAFVRAVEAAGLVLVGPSSVVVERMGRKDVAREIAVVAGVPVVPSGVVDPTTDPAADLATGDGMAFPVLVKAAAGGGGKGMRVVRSAQDYDAAVAAARREAGSAFGDDALLVERYVERGRHIEVQVFGDSHGSVVHLFERDCSVQRRHQKVLEEAPAPTLPAEVRRQVTTAATALARQVGYQGAGTVEFLLDEATGAAYFLEMNTRLQVEHPVTEAVVRVAGREVDLVELQLNVAAGEPLGFGQDDVSVVGHAIEARIYAEDAYAGYLPQAGTASVVRWPVTAGRVRVDHALESGQLVSTAYDPMLGKIIAFGSDREAARRALVAALDETAVLGLTTNAGFLRELAASEQYREAAIDTAWLDRAGLDGTALLLPDADRPRLLAAWVCAQVPTPGPAHPFRADGFRLGAPPAPTIVHLDREVLVDRAAGTVDGVPVREVSGVGHADEAAVEVAVGGEVAVEVGGEPVRGVVHVQSDPYRVVEVSYRGQRFVLTPPDRLAAQALVTDAAVTAPMPGTVLQVTVAVGDAVAVGDPLGVLEAMKMELTLRAPYDGTVVAVEAVAGLQVALGARLFEVAPDPAGEQ